MTVKWSHSALKDYEGCPRRYHEVKVLKNYPFKDTEATLYGKEFHTAAELYIKDDKPLPPQFSFAQATLDALKAKPGRKLCEYEMGVRADLTPCISSKSDSGTLGAAHQAMIKIIIFDTKTTEQMERIRSVFSKHKQLAILKPFQLTINTTNDYAHLHFDKAKTPTFFESKIKVKDKNKINYR